MTTQHVFTMRNRIIISAYSLIPLLAIGLFLSMIQPLQAATDDYVHQLTGSRLFAQPLVWIGQSLPNAEESQELWNAFGIGHYQKLDDAIAGLKAFSDNHPDSPWTPSLNANLGKYYRDHGYFSLALSCWEASWKATKAMTDSKGQQVANYTLVNWLNLLASLGRTDTMRELFDETKGRPLGTQQTFYDQSLDGYSMMLAHPEVSYRCGTYALNAVAQSLYGTNLFVQLVDQPSPSTGFSMSALLTLAESNHLNMVAVARPEGETNLVVPSVVHWKQNHYAAIISKRKGLFEVVDPTFRLHKWLTGEAINAESSGQFLVAAGHAPTGWQNLTSEQTSQILGKGYPWIFEPPPCPCNCPPPCPPGSGGSGGSGGAGGAGGCSICSQNGPKTFSAGSTGGMPDWKINEPNLDLRLHDEPLAYQSSVGRVSFQIDYWQRDNRTPLANVFGMGPDWECSWSAYVDNDTEIIYGASGGQIQISDDSGTTPNYYYNLLTTRNTDMSGNTTNYIVSYPTGAKDIYGFLVTDSYGNVSQAYLSQKIDAQGRATTFTYAHYDPLTNAVVQLLYVIDADGRTNSIFYTSCTDYNYLISQIKDPNNDAVNFSYDTNGYLTNVTDVANISSSFTYGYSTNVNDQSTDDYWINSLITPYGTTAFALFDYGGPNSNPYVENWIYDSFFSQIVRSAIITEPNGSHQMFLYEPFSGFIPNAITDDVPLDPPTSTLDGQAYMYYRNSFYWGPQQFDALSSGFTLSGQTNWDFTLLTTNDYLNGRWSHWNHSQDGGQSDALSMVQDFSPDGYTPGKRTWYDYPNKPQFNVAGSSASPSLVIKVLPDGTQSYQQYVVDQWNNATNVISTYSVNGTVLTRTNTYIYAPNGQDLLEAIGPDGVTNAACGYDSNHQVLFMTNALGEVTCYLYNANEQPVSITQPNGLITTNVYDANGFLAQQIVTGYSTNSYTYTNGLVYTHTDERRLTVTNSWDALNRLTNIAYPDGTSIKYVYNILDLGEAVDRLGNPTTYGYNDIRQKTAETNALGGVTLYGYCECGALYSVTDALQNVTYYIHDNQGNLIQTSYPDGYTITNTYNLIHQLVSRTDSSGMTISNWYNNQGLLVVSSNNVGRVQALAYDIDDRITNSIDANNVSVNMTYDNLRRILTRTYPDSGVEKYGYTADFSGPTSYTNQIGNATLWAYDLMNRRTNEVYVGVSNNKFTYNGAGDLIQLMDGNGNSTTWSYDQYGRVTNKVDAAGNLLFVYKYDADNRLTNRVSAAKGSTTYSYDAVGNLTHVTYPVSPAISLSYDALNRLTNMIDAVGTTVYGYDQVGQLLSAGGLWPNDTVNYSYANRLRTGMGVQAPNTSAWTQSYGYDSARRLTGITSPAGEFAYTYDSTQLQRVDLLTLPGDNYITNTYDSVARQTLTELVNVQGTNLDSYAYGYNQANQRTNVVRTAGDNVAYTYDNEGELTGATGYEANGGSRVIDDNIYSYDAAGNLLSKKPQTPGYGFITSYNLNSLNEITNFTYGGTTGRVATRVTGSTTSKATSVTVNGNAATLYSDNTFMWSPGPAKSLAVGLNTFTAIAQDVYGRLSTNVSTVNVTTNSLPLTYDLNGNLLFDGQVNYLISSARNFTYDDENQLIGVAVANSYSNNFVYDGKMRRRIERDYSWNGSSWTQTNEVHFIYDGNVVVQERNASNLPVVTYTRGNDLSGTMQGAGGIGGLLARTDMGQWISGSTFAHALYHADGNGNVTCLTFENGLTAAKYLYDPFGNTLAQYGSLAAANTYRFSSKEWNANSGLYYYLYRFYDSNLQRWLNRDPLGELGFFQIHPELTVFQQSLQKNPSINLENQILALSKKARDMHVFSPAELAQDPNLFVFVGNQPTLIYDFGGLSSCGNCYDFPALNTYCWVAAGLACGPVLVLPFGIVLYPICAYGAHNLCCFYEHHMGVDQ